MMKKNYTLSLDPSVMEGVDKVRGLVTKSAWINDVLRKVTRVVEKTKNKTVTYATVEKALNPKGE